MPPGERNPLFVGITLPSGVMRRHQPRKFFSLVNEPVRHSTTQMLPSRSNFETEGVFVIIAVDSPAVAHGLEHVGAAIAVGVLHARHFATLRAIEPAIAIRQAEHFVQATGEQFETRVRRHITERISTV